MASERYKTKYQLLPMELYNINPSFKEILFGVPQSIFSKKTSIWDEILPVSAKYTKRPLYLWE